MRVLLVGAELEENLAVRYLRGALVAAGHQVTQVVFDAVGDLEPVAIELARADADLIGLSMVFTRRAREFADLAVRVRELGCRTPIVAGGHFATFHAEELLRDVPAIDIVACGEGEPILIELLAADGRPDSVAGLVWRAPDGIRKNPAALKPLDLDTLAWPTRKDPPDRILGRATANMLSSRGCTHGCSFCSIAAWHRVCGGPRMRMRSVEAVADEMAALWRDGFRIFNFHDDNFFLRDRGEMLERVDGLRRALAERGVGRIAFAVKCRPDSAHPDVLAALQELGLFRLFLGIEAGTEQSLRQLGRAQSLSDNVSALDTIRTLGLHAAFNLLMFNPDSTIEDVLGNVAFLEQHADIPLNWCRTEVYSGTPLETRLRAQGRLLGDYWGYNYTIRDPRAEAACRVAITAFWNRNFTLDGLHHRAMFVDYEVHLVEHFGGPRPELRQRARQFVRDVNLDTARALDGIVRSCLGGAPADLGALARHWESRLDRSGARLAQEGRALTAEIRDAAAGRTVAASGWRHAARAAALAASVSLAAGCSGDADAVPSYASEMAPAPELSVPKLGDAAAVSPTLLPVLSGHALPTLLRFEVDDDGTVIASSVDATGLADAERDRVIAAVTAAQFPSPAWAARYEVRATDLAAPPAPAPDYTQFSETVSVAPGTVRIEKVPPKPDAPSAAEMENRMRVIQAIEMAVGPGDGVAVDLLGDEAMKKALAEADHARDYTQFSESVGLPAAEVRVVTKARLELHTPVDVNLSDGDPAAVEVVIQRRAGTFRAATEEALKSNPTVSGRLVVGWTVTMGRVQEAHVVDNTTGDDRLAASFLSGVRGTRFDPGTSGEIIATWDVSAEPVKPTTTGK